MEQERFDRLRLYRTERVGPVNFHALLKRFGSAGAALQALPGLANGSGPRPAPTATVEAELAAGERLGAKLLVIGDPGYPELLSVLDPPAPILWALGEPAIAARPSVAVVGARIASAAGQRFARALAAELGQAGYAVVSGMARGIDGAAHEGALPYGTTAVLGGGVDDVYPPEHADLHRRLAEGGCVVSESPVGARAQAKDFPRRNRLIAGLARATVVVEAELRSGSLITARLAAEAGREVFAVPGSPLDPRAKGANDLIRQGAGICEGAEDVLKALSALRTLREPGAVYGSGEEPPDVDRVRDRVAELLSPTPVPIDELVRATGASVATVSAALVELTLAGRAELMAGGMVCRAE